MQFIPNTILGFFDSSQKTYEIPVYQRAYSWEKANWETFLDDLREQIEGDNNYFFGFQILFCDFLLLSQQRIKCRIEFRNGFDAAILMHSKRFRKSFDITLLQIKIQ